MPVLQRLFQRKAPARLMLAGLALCAALSGSVHARWGSDSETEVITAGEQDSIRHDGLERTYTLHLPRSGSRGAMPLVVVLHGGYGDGKGFAESSAMVPASDRYGFAAVFPDGVDKHWNDGREGKGGSPDDVSFIRALVRHLVQTQNIDPRRVYVTGHSNGGAMSLRLACEASDVFAAVVTTGANFPSPYVSLCRPSRPVPLMMINGTADEFMPWNGGEGKGSGFSGRGSFASTMTTFNFWKQANGCSVSPQFRNLPHRNSDDPTRVDETRYSPCKGGSELVLLTIQGGGHVWPTGKPPERKLMGKFIGPSSLDISTPETAWQFFSRHSLD